MKYIAIICIDIITLFSFLQTRITPILLKLQVEV